ncbi:hypothetical protein GCM10018952_67160 [Streptosporangium vulgare]
MLAERAVGDRAPFGAAGAAAGEAQGGHVVRAARGDEEPPLPGAREQVDRRHRRGTRPQREQRDGSGGPKQFRRHGGPVDEEGVDPHPEHVGEMPRG